MTSIHRPVRIGVIGTGAIAQVMHLPILSERDDVVVAWVADVDGPKAASVAERFDVDRVLDPGEALENDDVDGLVIATPNHLHEPQAVAALEAGRHVLVERPMALTARGVERIIETASDAGKAVMISMGHRYRPDVSALSSFVASEELGRVFSVRSTSLNRRTPLGRAGWRHRKEAGGGALMDLGAPTLDLALWVVGFPEVERISAVLQRTDGGVEDAATLHAVAAGGISVSVEVSWTYYAEADYQFTRVLGTEGTGSLPPLSIHRKLGGRPLEITPRQPRPRGGESLYINAYRREIDHFVRVLAAEAEAPLPKEQIALTRVLEAAYRSAEEGREVEV